MINVAKIQIKPKIPDAHINVRPVTFHATQLIISKLCCVRSFLLFSQEQDNERST